MGKGSADDIYLWGYKNDRIISLTIELTTRCNWKCRHCYIPDHEIDGIPYEKAVEVISDVRRQGGFDLILTGGEILTRKDVLDLIGFSRRLGMQVSLLSNGSLVNEKIADDLARLYIQVFSMTVFSMDEKIHDFITQTPGSLKRTLYAAEILREKGVRVEFKTPVMRYNCDDISEVGRYAASEGYNYIVSPSIFPQTDFSSAVLNEAMSKTQLNQHIGEIDRISEFAKYQFVSEDDLCRSFRYSVFITASGEVYPCGSYPVELGNINTQNIIEIWNGEKARKVRFMKKKEARECSICDLYPLCNYCPGIAYLENKDISVCSKLGKAIGIARKESNLPIYE